MTYTYMIIVLESKFHISFVTACMVTVRLHMLFGRINV